MFVFPMFLNSKAMLQAITCIKISGHLPTLGEKLSATAEPENHHNKYVVKVLKDNDMVGHVPSDILKYCTSAILCGRTIKCEIAGKRQNKRGMGLKSRVNTL